MPRLERFARILALASTALAGWAGGGLAAPTYTVDLNYASTTRSTPFSRDTSYEVSSSNSTTTYTGHGTTAPGSLAGSCRAETNWLNGLSGGGGGRTAGNIRADDFVISGPGGSVTATLHLRAVGSFALNGGFAPSGGHQARVYMSADANGNGTFGDFTFYNGGTNTSGVFSGVSGPYFSVPFSLTGTFPVNSPFAVSISIEVTSGTYGNVNTNPGLAEGGVTVRLDDASAEVMTLPAGYTLNASSWNVVDNTWAPIVAVHPSETRPFDLWNAGANPAWKVSLGCRLPSSGPAEIAIFDLGGRRIRTLADGWQEAGERTFVWEGDTDAGASAPGGVYFARAAAGGRAVVRRIVRFR